MLRIRDSVWQHEAGSDALADDDQLLRTLYAIAPTVCSRRPSAAADTERSASTQVHVPRLSKEESRRRWAGIRTILNCWDPTGVIHNADAPDDEYECLAKPLWRLLERDASNAEVSSFLRVEIVNHFGLDARHYDFDAVADTLKKWFRHGWNGSLA